MLNVTDPWWSGARLSRQEGGQGCAHHRGTRSDIGSNAGRDFIPDGGGKCCHLTRSAARLSPLVIKEEL